MKKLIKLTRVLFKNTSLIVVSKGKWINRLLTLLLVFAGVSIMASFFALSNELFDQMAFYQQEGLLISYGVVGLSVMVFFFGIFYVLAMFYYSKDIELLLHMPFSPYQIIGSKLILVIVYEYIVTFVVFLPVMIAFGVNSEATLLYYVIGIVSMLLLPIIPLVIGGLFVMVIMRFTNIGKRKELMTFVGSILVLVVALGFNVGMQAFVGNTDEGEMVELLIQGNNSLAGMAAKLFPGASFAVNGMVHYDTVNGLMQFGLFVAMVVAFVAVFLIVGQKLYFKGVIGIAEAGAKRIEMDDKAWKKHRESKSVLSSFVVREFRMLMRSPTYFLNCVLISLIFPILFVVMFLIAPDSDPEITMLIDTLTSEKNEALKLAIFFAGGILFGSMNGITSTGVSREGSSAFVMKYIPVPMKTQVLSKVITGIIVAAVGMIMFGVGCAYIGLDLKIVIVGLIMSFNGIVFTMLLGMIIDLIRPKLVWDNEQQAVKQNLNMIINMLLGAAIGIGFVYLVITLEFSVLIIALITLPVFAIINYVIYLIMKKVAMPRFLQLDL